MSFKIPGQSDDVHQPDSEHVAEHFIPVRKSDLIDCLASKMPADQRPGFLQLSQILAATFHYEFHLRMEKHKNEYATLDPDRDTNQIQDQSEARCKAAEEKIAESFVANTMALLERANFSRLDRADIESTVGAASDWGVNLDVDFELFERLEVYARGDVSGIKTRRRLRNRYRKEQIEVPMYQRLVVVFQLRESHKLTGTADPNRIYLKLFKNIPKMDLDMLLPGTRVKITRLDQGKIILPTLSGVAMALVKIIKGVALLATATVTGVLSFLGLLGGTIGYGVKSFLGYQRTKDKYHLNLTRNLYFQNLDNNAGVLFRLLDEAEEQEIREAILAWFLLSQQAPQQGWTREELDRSAEKFLAEEFAIQVDFEIDDALDKLVRLGLCKCVSQNRWVATNLQVSLERLDRGWDNIFQHQEQKKTRRIA